MEPAPRTALAVLDLVPLGVGYRRPTQGDAVVGVGGYLEPSRSRGPRRASGSSILWNHIVALSGIHIGKDALGARGTAFLFLWNHIVALGGVHIGKDTLGARGSLIVFLRNSVVALSSVDIGQAAHGGGHSLLANVQNPVVALGGVHIGKSALRTGDSACHILLHHIVPLGGVHPRRRPIGLSQGPEQENAGEQENCRGRKEEYSRKHHPYPSL